MCARVRACVSMCARECVSVCINIYTGTLQSNTGLGRLTVEVSRSQTRARARAIGFLTTSDQPVTEADPYTTSNKHKGRTHALSGIRSRDPSIRAFADLRHSFTVTVNGL